MIKKYININDYNYNYRTFYNLKRSIKHKYITYISNN